MDIFKDWKRGVKKPKTTSVRLNDENKLFIKKHNLSTTKIFDIGLKLIKKEIKKEVKK